MNASASPRHGPDWPVAILVCRHVLHGAPIRLALREPDAGDWQVLCGGGLAHDGEDLFLVPPTFIDRRESPAIAAASRTPVARGATM